MPFGYDPGRKDDMLQWSRDQQKYIDARRTAAAPEAAQGPAPRPPTIAKLKKEEELRSVQKKRALRAAPAAPTWLSYSLVQSAHSRKLVNAIPEENPSTGSRIWDLGLLNTQLMHKVPCDACGKTGALMLAAQYEIQRGLASNFGTWCTHCRAVMGKPLATSRELPTASRKAKPMVINARAALGAANSGMGRTTINRFIAHLDMPLMGQRSYETVDHLVREACIAVGSASQRRALLEEQILSIEAGAEVNEDGRVPTVITYDGRWPKPGAAKNSMEGFGAAVGGRSKQVIATVWRSKDCARCKKGRPCGAGCNRMFAGPSGNMEPAMGAQIVTDLNSGATGVVVSDIVSDLDSNLAQAVAAACHAAGQVPPQTRYDPNHVGKAFDGKLLKEAKKQSRRGALGALTATRLSKGMRAALHQHCLSGEQTLKVGRVFAWRLRFLDDSARGRRRGRGALRADNLFCTVVTDAHIFCGCLRFDVGTVLHSAYSLQTIPESSIS